MRTITINSKKYNVSLEMNKFLKENKDCKQTFSFLFNLGLKIIMEDLFNTLANITKPNKEIIKNKNIMHYYQFKRTNLGNLVFIGKFNDKYDLQFNNGSVWYSEKEIESIKDNFLASNQRVVKNGKTWLKNNNLKKQTK